MSKFFFSFPPGGFCLLLVFGGGSGEFVVVLKGWLVVGCLADVCV